MSAEMHATLAIVEEMHGSHTYSASFRSSSSVSSVRTPVTSSRIASAHVGVATDVQNQPAMADGQSQRYMGGRSATGTLVPRRITRTHFESRFTVLRPES